MSKHKVGIGTEFQIDAVQDVPVEGAVEIANQLVEAGTRRTLTYLIVGIIASALAVAAIVDWSGYHGVWAATSSVWAAAGFPLGCVLGHFFAKKK
jgi:hypothetical protein